LKWFFCGLAIVAGAAPASAGNVDCDGHDVGNVVVTCAVPYGTVTPSQISNIYSPDPGAFPKPAHPIAVVVHGGGGSAGMDLQAYTLANDGFLVFQPDYDQSNFDLFPAFHEIQAVVRWVRKIASQHQGDPGHIAMIGGSAGGALVTHVANYTQLVTNPADPLFCANGRNATDIALCLASDALYPRIGAGIQAVVDEYGEGFSALDPTNFGQGSNAAMRANYPPILGVYPDDSSACGDHGGYGQVRQTLTAYLTATGRTPDNYSYVGNHAFCPLPAVWLTNNRVPACQPVCPLPLFAADQGLVDDEHGQNINTVLPSTVATGAAYPCQWPDQMTVFHCIISRWIVALPGFQP